MLSFHIYSAQELLLFIDCLEVSISAYHIWGGGSLWSASLLFIWTLASLPITWTGRGIMVAGWPLVIVWRLASLPITWEGRGIMVVGWPLVIIWRLVSLPITWTGRGLWWPAGLLLLSGG